MVMRTSRGTVDTDFPDHFAYCIRFGLDVGEEAIPQPLASPAIEAICAGLPGSISLGEIPPGRSRAQFPQDPVDDPAMIPPLTTPRAAPR